MITKFPNLTSYLLIAKNSFLPSRLQFTFLLLLLLPTFIMAQDTLIKIGETGGPAMMRLQKNGSFFIGGNYDGGTNSLGIPAEGPGTRLIWYPSKGAFRAGHVTGSLWDEANIGYFSVAMGENVRASASYTTAFGLSCTASQTSSFSVGEQNTASGAASVAMGYHAHTNARQGSFVFADRSTVDTIRAGVNHSANWRVSGGFRIFTSSNLSTGVTIQSGSSVSNWGQSNAVISTSTGAYLSTAGVWQSVSDVNRKHQFQPISGEEILSRLRSVSIKSWGYRAEPDSVRHVGPTAQDFYAAFNLGNDARTIGAVDADGIALASVQALEVRTHNLSAELTRSKAENEALKMRLEILEKKSDNGSILSSLPFMAIVGSVSLFGFMRNRRCRKSQQT